MGVEIRAVLLALAIGGCDSSEPADASSPQSAPEAAAETSGDRPTEAAAEPDAAQEPALDPSEPAGATVVQAFVPKSPEEYVGKHVILASGAVLRSAPNDEAPSAVVRRDPAAEGLAAAGTMEVVGAEGEFIAVRPAMEDKRCTDTAPGLADWDLKVWVRPHELSPVLGLRTDVRDPSGDLATLSPGVPVGENGRSAVVDVGGTILEVALDHTVISTAFDPEPHPKPPEDAHQLDKGPPVKWGGKALNEAALLGSTEGHPQPLAVRGKDDVITVWARCAALTGMSHGARGSVAYEEVPPAPSLYGYGIAGAMGDNDRWIVRTGAEVLWPDGTSAGSVAAEQELTHKPRTKKGRACFSIALVDDPAAKIPKDAKLSVCFEESAVRYEPGLASVIASLSMPSSSAGAFASALTASEDLDALDALMTAGAGELDDGFGMGAGLGAAVDIGGGGGGLAAIGGGGSSIGKLGGGSTSSGKVKLESGTSTTGDINQDVARRIARAHVSEIRACYNDYLADTEGASGSLELDLTIDTSGKVTGVSIEDGVGGTVGSCVAKKAKRWKFPAPSTESTASLSFTFTAL